MAFDRRLGTLFGFDGDDLDANRRGRLSAEQARGFATAVALDRRRSRPVLVVFFLLLAATLVFAVATSAEGSSADLIGPLAVVGVMGTFLVLLVAFFRRRVRRDQAVQAAGQVLAAQGPFGYDPTWDGTWGVEIGGVRFLVELLQYQALDDGAVYRAYFLPTEPHATLLSIEVAP